MEERKYLKELAKAGIEFSVSIPYCGQIHLSPSAVLEYSEDKEAFISKLFGVKREDIVKYLKFMNEKCQCMALTKKGKRCRIAVEPTPELNNFDFENGYFCSVHR